MFRVIDTIRLNETTLRTSPDLMARLGQGLLVILDPTRVSSVPFQEGATVRVHRPDGASFDRVVSAMEIQHGAVGVFFRDMEQHEIPRLSEIELLAV